MKATLIGFALLMSGTAIAQTTTSTDAGTMTDNTPPTTTSSTTADTTGQTSTDMQATDTGTMTDTSAQSSTMTDTSTQSSTMSNQSAMSSQDSMTMASNMAPASAAVVQAGNTNPEKDARGITVMSEAANVPAGWNGVTGSAVGGPLVDASTGQTVSGSDSYPACSATVTDNCLQSYERGRS